MKQVKIAIFVSLFFALAVTSCKKNEYLVDEGVHDGKTPLNTYDYLKSNQYKLFDSFLLIIDKFNLKNELMQAKTVFAVTDYSIRNYIIFKQNAIRLIDINKTFTMDSVYANITADSVRQYFFSQKISLDEVPMEPEVTQVTSVGQTTCGFSKRQWSILELNGNDGGLTTWTNSPIYGLFYTRVRGALDVPGVPSPPNEIDIKVLCQTQGIMPKSFDKDSYDQMLHVLANTHTFVRF